MAPQPDGGGIIPMGGRVPAGLAGAGGGTAESVAAATRRGATVGGTAGGTVGAGRTAGAGDMAGAGGAAGGVALDAAGVREDGGGTTGPGTIWIWSPVWLVAGRCGHCGRCGIWRSPPAPGCA
jgi:hypothetical protein